MSTTFSSTSFAKRCIERDLKEIRTNDSNSPIIFADQVDDNSFHIEAAFSGPLSTPYADGIFVLDLKLSDDYPFVPPQSIVLKRATMHPNVDESGKFMSELFQPTSWTPTMTVKHIIEHVWIRFAVPDVDSTECDLTRAHSYRTDRENFEIIAREYSMKYAAAT